MIKTSKLLHQLRTQLNETSSTAAIVSFCGSGPRRRRRRKRDAVDALVEATKTDEELVESCLTWLGLRSKAKMSNLKDHPVYQSSLVALESGLPTITERSASELSSVVSNLLEEVELGAEFESNHKKFSKALASKFKVTVTRTEPVAEGLYLYTSTEDTTTLSHQLEQVRKFAEEKNYIMIKKGTTDDTAVGTDDAQWGFIYDPNLGADTGDLGEFD